MSTSELVLTVIPVAWFLGATYFIPRHEKLKFVLRGGAFLIACLALSYFLHLKLSQMMGGQWVWGDVAYYGWMLFSFFTILQIFKKASDLALRRLIQWPRNEKIRKALVTCICYVVLFVTMIPFFLAMTSIHRVKIGDAFNPRTEMGVVYEDVSLRTEDGLNIKGWFIPAISNKAVIIAHGLGANKSNFSLFEVLNG